MAAKDCKVIAVLNMKGGVGKTTISAHVMRVLYHQQKNKTLLIDLDPQFNLSQCLLSRKEYDELKKKNATVFQAFEPPSDVSLFEVAKSKLPPPKPASIAKQLRSFKFYKARLDLVPGDFRLVKYSLIDDKNKLEHARKRFLQFIELAKADYDLLVIDCNPSSSFITLCALTACTHLLVPVRPDKYSMLGLEMLADFVEGLPDLHPKPEMAVLLNGIPTTKYDPEVENALRAHKKFGPLILANKLKESKLLVASEGYTGFATDKPVSYKDLLRTHIASITSELATRWDI